MSPGYNATMDQAEMTYRDLAKLHYTYYQKLREQGMDKRAARAAMITVVTVQFTHMFTCTHKG